MPIKRDCQNALKNSTQLYFVYRKVTSNITIWGTEIKMMEKIHYEKIGYTIYYTSNKKKAGVGFLKE